MAVPLPKGWRERLKELHSLLPGARWVAPEKYHITLQFLGAKVDDALLPEIVRQIASIPFASFEIEVDGVGHFKKRGRSTVLWARVCRQAELTQLHEAVVEAMAALGFERESSYQPHITLCYLGKPDVEAQVDDWLTRHADFQLTSFRVREFELYESKNGVYVPRHSIISLDD